VVTCSSVIEIQIDVAMTVPQPDDSSSQNDSRTKEVERRKASTDRRSQDAERRNSDRVSQDLEPRRDPDRKDRRDP
jgi:hypothetical protein